jgi:hypothetical protein
LIWKSCVRNCGYIPVIPLCEFTGLYFLRTFLPGFYNTCIPSQQRFDYDFIGQPVFHQFLFVLIIDKVQPKQEQNGALQGLLSFRRVIPE